MDVPSLQVGVHQHRHCLSLQLGGRLPDHSSARLHRRNGRCKKRSWQPSWPPVRAAPREKDEKLHQEAEDQATHVMDDFEDSLEKKPASEVLGNLVGVHE